MYFDLLAAISNAHSYLSIDLDLYCFELQLIANEATTTLQQHEDSITVATTISSAASVWVTGGQGDEYNQRTTISLFRYLSYLGRQVE